MGASRSSTAALASFLTDARARGTREALRTLNLEHLAGRSVEEVLLGLADYVCPDGGSVDEGIAREAFMETIVELVELGVTEFDALTTEQIQTVLEVYVTNAIEARLCNDIGTKAISMPRDARQADRVVAQIRDFIRRGVSDALASSRATLDALTRDRASVFIDQIYVDAFSVLQSLGEEAAES
jgi:hypothetical protein